MIRITRSGAACSRQSRQTPRASSALTDPSSKALVRTSDAVGALATSAVSTPADASAIAAVRPAGPAPTIATSAVKRFIPLLRTPIAVIPTASLRENPSRRSDNSNLGTWRGRALSGLWHPPLLAGHDNG